MALALFFVLLVGGLLLNGLISLYQTRRYVKISNRTTGIVIEQKLEPGETDTYRPIVRFTASDGKAVEFADYWSRSHPKVNVGEEVSVLYSPEDPKKARIITNNFELYYGTILSLFLGTVFLLSGILIAAVFAFIYFFEKPDALRN